MNTPIPRRTLLAAAGATAVGLSVPGVADAAGPRRTTTDFTLNAETLDGGEQVVSVTLHTAELGKIIPSSLTDGTFTVHAKATSPIPIAAGDLIFSEYDLDRSVTTARLDRRGNIVLELDYAEGQLGGGTLGYIVSQGTQCPAGSGVHDHPERSVEAAERASAHDHETGPGSPLQPRGRRLRLRRLAFEDEVPALLTVATQSRGKRPLIVWLHGGGEGASLPDDYYDNESTLRANRGALGFATPEGQRIFGGAYVVAPQSTSFWIGDGPAFAPQIKEIIDEVARRYPIDRDQIHVVGCSNGGYMTMKMTVEYPRLFASAVPICGVVQPFGRSPRDPRARRHHHADLAGRLRGRRDGDPDPTPARPRPDPRIDS